jgi:acyl-CoA reductase-like NAD-dependent aldehyde dehydrogenase
MTMGPLAHADRFYIGGRWAIPRGSSTIAVRNSATEKTYFRVATASDDDVLDAIAAARTAFDEGPWPRLSHTDRAVYVRQLGIRIIQESDRLARIWTTQTGVLFSLSAAHVQRIGSLFCYYADMAETFPFIERHEPSTGGHLGYLVREPVGVVGAIIPWNGALSDIAAKIGPALIAGCTVVLKASPQAPGEAYAFAEIAESVGLPPGVLNLVLATSKASERLVRDERVDKIAFTGSTAVGRRIASILGGRVARYTLELGGKSAAIVLDDADIGNVAEVLTNSTIRLSGQACSALTRVIVTTDERNALLDALVERFCKLRLGDPFDPEVDMGPLVSNRHRHRVERHIATGRSEGARIAIGGKRPVHLRKGYFIEPTLMWDVNNAASVAQQEIFGPVLCVITAPSECAAIQLANDSIYGLNASVFTNDPDRALNVARQLRTGTVGHNALRTDMHIARGGFKQSGVGREGGTEGLLGYLEPKTVILDGEPSMYKSV